MFNLVEGYEIKIYRNIYQTLIIHFFNLVENYEV